MRGRPSFECVRKLSLVGIPVFFAEHEHEQLLFGLIVCFFTVCVFMWCRPYRTNSDNALQLLCQVDIFFALLSKVMLDLDPDVDGRGTDALGVLLVVMALIPVASLVMQAIFEGNLPSFKGLKKKFATSSTVETGPPAGPAPSTDADAVLRAPTGTSSVKFAGTPDSMPKVSRV